MHFLPASPDRTIEKLAAGERAQLSAMRSPYLAFTDKLAMSFREEALPHEALLQVDLHKRSVIFNTNAAKPESTAGGAREAEARHNLLEHFAIIHDAAHIVLRHTIREELVFPTFTEAGEPFSWGHGDKLTYQAPHFDANKTEEWEADIFAANFLVPRAELLKFIRLSFGLALTNSYMEESLVGNTAGQERLLRSMQKLGRIPKRALPEFATNALHLTKVGLEVTAKNFGVHSGVIEHQLSRPPYPEHGLIATSSLSE